MPKILLLYPPSRIQYHQSCPMGIQLLASVLEKHGYEVILLDANAAKGKMDSRQIIEFACRVQPDVIGMTLLTPMIREAYTLARSLKKHRFKLLAGGPHATLMPEETVQQGFDAAVVGEGETVIHEAAQALMGNIPKDQVLGWVYRDEQNNAVMTAPRPFITDLDTVPLPAYHMVDPALYGGRVDGVLHGNIFSSRGCTAKCSFCSGQLFGKRFRFRSAQSILNEIEYLHTTFGTSEFHFVDDAMTLHKKRLREFCDGLKQRNLKIGWTIMTRIDAVDEDFLSAIKDAGCSQIDYGVESGQPVTLRKIHKPHTVDMVRKVIPMTARVGITPNVFFILGFPWEDVAALDDSLQLMKELAPNVGSFHPAVASILIPFPGTEIYEQYKTECGFENWWLSEEKNYDTLVPKRTSYYEGKIFHLGNILKADFFHYSQPMKDKIYEIFEFMYMHNLSLSQSLQSRIQQRLIAVSKQLTSRSTVAERLMFKPVWTFEHILKAVR